MTQFPGETAEQVLKRAEVAFVNAIEFHNKAEGSQGTPSSSGRGPQLAGPELESCLGQQARPAPRLGNRHRNLRLAGCPKKQRAFRG